MQESKMLQQLLFVAFIKQHEKRSHIKALNLVVALLQLFVYKLLFYFIRIYLWLYVRLEK